MLLRENNRKKNSHVIFSDDEGTTWAAPRELPASLTGDRHTGQYAPDGRLFISFRDTTLETETAGDWVAWVGMSWISSIGRRDRSTLVSASLLPLVSVGAERNRFANGLFLF